LNLTQCGICPNITDIIPSLTKVLNSLINFSGSTNHNRAISLSFITNFANLQILSLS